MHDGYIPTSRLVTWCLWSATVVLVVSAWLTTVFVSHDYGHLLGMTATCLASAATVCHVRCIIRKSVRHVVARLAPEDEVQAHRNARATAYRD